MSEEIPVERGEGSGKRSTLRPRKNESQVLYIGILVKIVKGVNVLVEQLRCVQEKSES